MAEPGTVLVSQPTHILLRGRFETESVGALSLKGVSRPMEAFRVTKAAAGTSTAQRAREHAMVDRTHERQRLVEPWRQAKAGARRGVVVSGEPGVGKSTLIGYLQSVIAEEPHIWLQAQCSSLAEATPLHPFVELIRRRLGITEELAVEGQLTRLHDGLGAVGLASPDALHLMALLLDIPTGANATGRILDPLHALFEATVP